MDQRVRLAVVLKGSQHQYWKSVTAGTAEAERDLQLQGMRVRLIRRSPLRDDGRQLGLTTLMDFLQGKTVARRIDTGATLVTPENMDVPEIQELLYPPVLAL